MQKQSEKEDSSPKLLPSDCYLCKYYKDRHSCSLHDISSLSQVDFKNGKCAWCVPFNNNFAMSKNEIIEFYKVKELYDKKFPSKKREKSLKYLTTPWREQVEFWLSKLQ
jgi:hypothetical protein